MAKKELTFRLLIDGFYIEKNIERYALHFPVMAAWVDNALLDISKESGYIYSKDHKGLYFICCYNINKNGYHLNFEIDKEHIYASALDGLNKIIEKVIIITE